MVRRDNPEDRREPCGHPIGRRIGSTFRSDGGKYFTFILPLIPKYDLFIQYIYRGF